MHANMTTNPYTPPTAAVADVPANGVSLPGGSEAVPPFFAVSVPKLAVLSLCSLGVYEIYWFYKNWQLIRARERSNIYPFPRAVFAVLFCYQCFARMRDYGTELEIAPPLAAGALAAGWIITTIAYKLPDPYSLVSLLSVVFLLPVQAHVNRINQALVPTHEPNASFSGWNWFLAIVGGCLLILAIIGTLMPAK